MSEDFTAGPWHWVDAETDAPWDGRSVIGGYMSLRTVERFGKDEVVVRDGKNYTSWALPKFILSTEEINTEADARLIAAAPDLFVALSDLRATLKALIMAGGATSDEADRIIAASHAHKADAALAKVSATPVRDEDTI